MSKSNKGKKVRYLPNADVRNCIESIQLSTFQDIGSKEWVMKHKCMDKLKLKVLEESVIDCTNTAEAMIQAKKISVLIQDLIFTEIWIDGFKKGLLQTSTPDTKEITTILSHEATCMTLLKTILRAFKAFDVLGGCMVELLDYILRSLQMLLHIDTNENGQFCDELHAINLDIDQKSQRFKFGISFQCLECLLYIVEEVDTINSECCSRLTHKAEVLLILTDILIKKPWISQNQNYSMIYDVNNQEWNRGMEQTNKSDVDLMNWRKRTLPKPERQTWRVLIRLTKKCHAFSTYELQKLKINYIKLYDMINDTHIAENPEMFNFKKWLNEFSATTGSVFPFKFDTEKYEHKGLKRKSTDETDTEEPAKDLKMDKDEIDIGCGIAIPIKLVEKMKEKFEKCPYSFFKNVAIQGNVFSLKYLAQHGITGRQVFPALEQQKWDSLFEFTVKTLHLNANQSDLLKSNLASLCKNSRRDWLQKNRKIIVEPNQTK